MPRLVSPLFLLLGILLSPLGQGAAGAGGEPEAEFLVRRAAADRLGEDPYWHTLLHFKRSLAGGRSLVDDPKFFLAPEGNRNPQAELEATIRALFGEDEARRQEARCRFPARYVWLRERLGLDTEGMPEAGCEAFEKTMERIRPRAATLVFPTSYVNSPASMFGHTLIRIETFYESKLLSQAVNYSAVTDETNGFLFAFKGIFGFYEGYFSILPYYDKVEEYNDIDQRDIWEYPLSLTEEEVLRMLRHLWELQNIYSHYYFFDENCSYTLLFLFDAARPNLHLTDRFGWWVMPIDTIRAVREAGLIEGAVYRPSKATRIRHLMNLLDPNGVERALAIAEGRSDPQQALEESGSSASEARVLDLAAECIQYRYAKQELDKEAYTSRFLKTLTARSRLGPAAEIEREIPVPVEPTLGHRSNKVSVSCGVRNFERAGVFEELRYRPTYHDLLDPEEGYVDGAQIVFLDTTLRVYDEDGRVQFQGLDLVNIHSVAARDAFFKPISWKVNTGLVREKTPQKEEALLYGLSAGGGYSYRMPASGLVSILLDADIRAGDGLEDRYSLGLGGSLEVLKGLGKFWKVRLYARPIYCGPAGAYLKVEFGCAQRFRLGANSAFQLEFSGMKIPGDLSSEFKGSWGLFF